VQRSRARHLEDLPDAASETLLCKEARWVLAQLIFTRDAHVWEDADRFIRWPPARLPAVVSLAAFVPGVLITGGPERDSSRRRKSILLGRAVPCKGRPLMPPAFNKSGILKQRSP
jgi:hypothetical protein